MKHSLIKCLLLFGLVAVALSQYDMSQATNATELKQYMCQTADRAASSCPSYVVQGCICYANQSCLDSKTNKCQNCQDQNILVAAEGVACHDLLGLPNQETNTAPAEETVEPAANNTAPNGANGTNGENGENGANGQNGGNGQNGQNGGNGGNATEESEQTPVNNTSPAPTNNTAEENNEEESSETSGNNSTNGTTPTNGTESEEESVEPANNNSTNGTESEGETNNGGEETPENNNSTNGTSGENGEGGESSEGNVVPSGGGSEGENGEGIIIIINPGENGQWTPSIPSGQGGGNEIVIPTNEIVIPASWDINTGGFDINTGGFDFNTDAIPQSYFYQNQPIRSNLRGYQVNSGALQAQQIYVPEEAYKCQKADRGVSRQNVISMQLGASPSCVFFTDGTLKTIKTNSCEACANNAVHAIAEGQGCQNYNQAIHQYYGY